jgi:diketogulonate reductase-like aldo/keto reductase
LESALACGYRHIDTANMYGNEAVVGEVLRKSSVVREEVFITSKFWPSSNSQLEVKEMVDASVKAIGYLDLLLVHFPCAAVHLAEGEARNGRWYGDIVAESEEILDWREQTWRTIETFVKDGRVKHLGVSNFQKEHIEHVLSFSEISPIVNQIEMHPVNYSLETELLAFCAEKDIAIAAYCPLRKGDSRLLGQSAIQTIAGCHGKTAGQALLRWSLQKGFVALPKSTTPQRIAENIDIFDFELSAEEMVEIDTVGAALYPCQERKRLWCSAEMGVP